MNRIDRIRVNPVHPVQIRPRNARERNYVDGKTIAKESIWSYQWLANEIVDKRGSWYLYGETRIGQGRENVRNFLKENRDLLEEIEGKVLVACGLGDEQEAAEE